MLKRTTGFAPVEYCEDSYLHCLLCILYYSLQLTDNHYDAAEPPGVGQLLKKMAKSRFVYTVRLH